MTSWQLYWLTRCDGLNEFGWFLTVVTGIGLAIAIFAWVGMMFEEDESAVKAKHLALGIAPIFTVGLTMALLIPTTKEIAAIFVIPKIANSQTVQELGDATKTLALEWLEELRPEPSTKTRK